MTYKNLLNELSYVNHSRDKRTYYAKMVLENPDLVPLLLQILFDVNKDIGSRAGWVLESVCKKNIFILKPYIDDFTTQMPKVYLDSAVRTVAKICECLIKNHIDKKVPAFKQFLKPIHIERIITLSFDYLIGDHRVAPKVYAMQSLFWLSVEFPWILPELQTILEQNYPNECSGYKARARKILDKIKLKSE